MLRIKHIKCKKKKKENIAYKSYNAFLLFYFIQILREILILGYFQTLSQDFVFILIMSGSGFILNFIYISRLICF